MKCRNWIFFGALVTLLFSVTTNVTLANGSASVTLVGAGDIHCSSLPDGDPTKGAPLHSVGATATAKLVTNVVENNPNAYEFTLGDNVDDITDDTRDCFEKTWGTPFLRGRTFPVIGNHDRTKDGPDGKAVRYGPPTSLFSLYPEIFACEEQSSPPCEDVESKRYQPYYTRPLGDAWLLLVLDSSYLDHNTSDSHGYVPGYERYYADQENWVERALTGAKNDNRCVIAMWHHPVCPDCVIETGGADRGKYMNKIWKTLVGEKQARGKQARASLVLTGHHHFFREFKVMNREFIEGQGGLTQLIVGTGGANTDIPSGGPSSIEKSPGLSKYPPLYSTKGVVILQLHNGQRRWGEWRFRNIENVDMKYNGTFECR